MAELWNAMTTKCILRFSDDKTNTVNRSTPNPQIKEIGNSFDMRQCETVYYDERGIYYAVIHSCMRFQAYSIDRMFGHSAIGLIA